YFDNPAEGQITICEIKLWPGFVGAGFFPAKPDVSIQTPPPPAGCLKSAAASGESWSCGCNDEFTKEIDPTELPLSRGHCHVDRGGARSSPLLSQTVHY